jgi:hypothetical protein
LILLSEKGEHAGEECIGLNVLHLVSSREQGKKMNCSTLQTAYPSVSVPGKKKEIGKLYF